MGFVHPLQARSRGGEVGEQRKSKVGIELIPIGDVTDVEEKGIC